MLPFSFVVNSIAEFHGHYNKCHSTSFKVGNTGLTARVGSRIDCSLYFDFLHQASHNAMQETCKICEWHGFRAAKKDTSIALM